jgi:inosine triphosphate pyrophosphatase
MPPETFPSAPRFVTSNALKLRDAQALVPDLVPFEVDLVEIQSMDVLEVVKSKLAALVDMHLSFPVVVEDTGLEISTLGGLPGPLVKWFLAAVGSKGLADIALRGERATPAIAVSAVGVLQDQGQSFWMGRVEGEIVQPRGVELGWNSIFRPMGSSRTFGEMTDDQRLEFSMRRTPLLLASQWLKRIRDEE